MPFSKTAIFAATAILACAVPVSAAQEKQPVPEVFQEVAKCREIAEGDARLACFDAAVAELVKAEAADDVVVISREQVRDTRRGLFGLKLPSLKIFGGKGEDDGIESVKQLEATIAAVGQGRKGFVFRLEDGAVWDQTDGAYIRTPKPGDVIVIERAALGSYFARVNGGVSIRVKRRD